MKRVHSMLPFVVVAALFFVLPVWAESGKKSEHHGDHGGKAKMSKPKGGKHAHHFSEHWSKTLSDEQKLQVDMMHLALGRELAVLKAREELVQKEINVLTAQDNADKNAIYTKIDEFLEIKKQILRHRYDHILEMRGILTPAQRVSYDMGVLKRSGVK